MALLARRRRLAWTSYELQNPPLGREEGKKGANSVNHDAGWISRVDVAPGCRRMVDGQFVEEKEGS